MSMLNKSPFDLTILGLFLFSNGFCILTLSLLVLFLWHQMLNGVSKLLLRGFEVTFI